MKKLILSLFLLLYGGVCFAPPPPTADELTSDSAVRGDDAAAQKKRRQLAELREIVRVLQRDFPQFEAETLSIAGDVRARIMDPDKPSSALIIITYSPPGIGKTSYWETVATLFRAPLKYKKCEDGDPFFPVEQLFELIYESRSGDGLLKGVLLVDESQRIAAPTTRPLFEEIRKRAEQKAYDEKIAHWRRDQAAKRHAVAPIPIVLQQPEQGRRRGNNREPEPAPQIIVNNPIPPEPTTPEVIPDDIILEARAHAEREGEKAKKSAEDEWRKWQRLQNPLRDATSGRGDVPTQKADLPKIVAELRAALGAYATEALRAKDAEAPAMLELELKIQARKDKLKTLADPAEVEKARRLRAGLGLLAQKAETAKTTYDQLKGEDPTEEKVATQQAKRNWDTERGEYEKVRLELTTLPSEAAVAEFTGVQNELQQAEGQLDALKKKLRIALQTARTNLGTKLSTDTISARLLALDPGLMDRVQAAVLTKTGKVLVDEENLLEPKDLFNRLISEKPTIVIEVLHAYTESIAGTPKVNAGGYVIGVAGNDDPSYREGERNASDPNDPDSRAASMDRFLESPNGRTRVDMLGDKLLGNFPGEDGIDQDARSRRSRMPVRIHRGFDVAMWRRIIRGRIERELEEATLHMSRDLNIKVKAFRFTDSVIDVLYSLGANADSDLRPLAPHLRTFSQLFYTMIDEAHEKFAGKELMLIHDKDKGELSIVTKTGETTEVLAVVPFKGKNESTVATGIALSDSDRRLLSRREATRITFGLLLFASRPRDGRVEMKQNQLDVLHWNKPSQNFESARYDLGMLLMHLGSIEHEQSLIFAPNLPQETRRLREEVEKQLKRFYRETVGDTHFEANGNHKGVFILTQLTPEWFISAEQREILSRETDDQDGFLKICRLQVRHHLGRADFRALQGGLFNLFLADQLAINGTKVQAEFAKHKALFDANLGVGIARSGAGEVPFEVGAYCESLAAAAVGAPLSVPVAAPRNRWAFWRSSK